MKSEAQKSKIAPWNKGRVQIKTVGLKISQLTEIMPSMQMGRFHEMKKDLREHVLRTPAGEFFLLTVARNIARDKKEQGAMKNAITNMFEKLKMPWTCRWTNIKEAFIIIRKEDWAAQKRGK